MTLLLRRLDEQPVLRRRLDRFLETTTASPTARHRAALVASELFTNAIEHGAAAPVRISVEVDDDIELVVSHPSSTGEAVSTERAMPPATSARGRGLAIVNRLTLQVRTDVVGGWHRTEAILATDG